MTTPIKNNGLRPSSTSKAAGGDAPAPKSEAGQPASSRTGKPGTAKAATSAAAALPTLNEQAIVCPVLSALVAQGKLHPGQDGTVDMTELTMALASIGQSKPFQVGTHPIGWGANTLSEILPNLKGDHFNVMELRSGLIKHPGDSAILTAGKFDEQKFKALASHAEHRVMTMDSFGKAIAANVLRDAKPGQVMDDVVRGLNFSSVEFGALLATFGTRNNVTGKLGITVDDLRGLYQRQEIPPGRSGYATLVNASALSATLALKADANLAGHALSSLGTATGLAHRGATLAEGNRKAQDGAAGQAALSAGKAASCPYLNGVAKMPCPPADALNAHTQAGMRPENQ